MKEMISESNSRAIQFKLPTVWKNSLRMVLAGIGLLAVLSMSACASYSKSAAGGCGDSCAMKQGHTHAAECKDGQCPMKKAAASAEAPKADCPCQKAKSEQPAG
jgi:hypothetical protein